MQPENASKSSTPVSGHTVLVEGLTELAKLESELAHHQQDLKQKEASSALSEDDHENSFFLSMDAALSLSKLIDQGCISSEFSYEMAKNIQQAGTELYPDAWHSAFPDGLPPLESLAAGAEVKRNEIAEDRELARLEGLKPITVRVSGRMEYPEDDPLYGTYTIQTTMQLTKSDSITEAVNAVAEAHKNNDWNIRDPKRDYYDEDFGRDMGPIRFYPNAVEIVDKDNVRVMAGHFKSGLTWETPATDQEITRIQEQIHSLKEESSFQRGWDNHETGRKLTEQAQRLETKLTGSDYRDNQEVLAVLEKQAQEQHSRDPEAAYKTEVSQARQQKEDQAGRLEKQLLNQIIEHKAEIKKLEGNRPGLLASSDKKEVWNQSLSSETALLEKKEARLQKVESLHHDMGLNGSRLEQLAVEKVRFEKPGLASARDQSIQEKRMLAGQERMLRQGERKSHSMKI